MDNTISCYFGSHPHDRPSPNSVSNQCRSSCTWTQGHTLQHATGRGQGSFKANGKLNYLFLNPCPKENIVLGKQGTPAVLSGHTVCKG